MQPIRRWQTASAVPHAPGTNRFELPVRLSPRPRRARHSVSAGVAKGGRAASAGRQLRTKSLRERVRKKLREVPLTCLEQGGPWQGWQVRTSHNATCWPVSFKYKDCASPGGGRTRTLAKDDLAGKGGFGGGRSRKQPGMLSMDSYPGTGTAANRVTENYYDWRDCTP